MHQATITSTPRETTSLVVFAATISLNQQLHNLAHELRVFLLADALLQFKQPVVTLLYNVLRYLVIILSRRRTRARAVLEGKSTAETSLFHNIEGCLEVVLRFSRETNDNIRGNRGMGKLRANLIQNSQETLRPIGTSHVLKHPIRPRLQWHMKLRANIRGFSHRINHVRRELRRMRTSKPHSFQSLNLTARAQ